MSKTIHFVSGLPRAGSTLLMNVLAQNPRIHSTATSGLHEIGYIARQFSATEQSFRKNLILNFFECEYTKYH